MEYGGCVRPCGSAVGGLAGVCNGAGCGRARRRDSKGVLIPFRSALVRAGPTRVRAGRGPSRPRRGGAQRRRKRRRRARKARARKASSKASRQPAFCIGVRSPSAIRSRTSAPELTGQRACRGEPRRSSSEHSKWRAENSFVIAPAKAKENMLTLFRPRKRSGREAVLMKKPPDTMKSARSDGAMAAAARSSPMRAPMSTM
mmetsp:Transcript_35013/g.59960  ORF Transcript_35013/g.59960 Transcript_35013/m.59960 type:complete len:201 (-) Transcript_35013:435-1037(-)